MKFRLALRSRPRRPPDRSSGRPPAADGDAVAVMFYVNETRSGPWRCTKVARLRSTDDLRDSAAREISASTPSVDSVFVAAVRQRRVSRWRRSIGARAVTATSAAMPTWTWSMPLVAVRRPRCWAAPIEGRLAYRRVRKAQLDDRRRQMFARRFPNGRSAAGQAGDRRSTESIWSRDRTMAPPEGDERAARHVVRISVRTGDRGHTSTMQRRSIMICATGTDQCRVLRRDEMLPAWPRFSPDGRRLPT